MSAYYCEECSRILKDWQVHSWARSAKFQKKRYGTNRAGPFCSRFCARAATSRQQRNTTIDEAMQDAQ